MRGLYGCADFTVYCAAIADGCPARPAANAAYHSRLRMHCTNLRTVVICITESFDMHDRPLVIANLSSLQHEVWCGGSKTVRALRGDRKVGASRRAGRVH